MTSPHRRLFATLRFAVPWLLLAGGLGAVVGTAVAVFLWSLNLVTNARETHPWLLWTLPALGFAVGWVYHTIGRDAEAGSNLILDKIHDPGAGGGGRVPRRMAPLVLIGTLLTHLGGGSAGREGTAVQMGGSLASAVGRVLRLSPEKTRTLLTAGIAAGFGAVFGTPLAGAVFAVEVLTAGRLRHDALWPCLVAAVVGDWVCSAYDVHLLGQHFAVHHTHYAVAAFARTAATVDPLLLGKAAVAGVAFGWAAAVFVAATHAASRLFRRLIAYPPLRPALGGLIVIGMTYVVGTHDYLGLGVPGIVRAFDASGTPADAWAWKTVFTAVTLGSGFKGGEVTPLFFVGATLGHTLAVVLNAPVDLFAALGFVAVFAGATKTPLACTIMGVELFAGGETLAPGLVVCLATACGVAYLFGGTAGIYRSQRTDDGTR